jgi:hypothetical protein
MRSGKRGRWAKSDEARLRDLFGLRDDQAIARELNRSVASVRRMAKRIFPAEMRSGPWTANEILELKRYLGASTPEVIARVMGRSVQEITAQIVELGRIRRQDDWTREEVAEFKRIFGTHRRRPRVHLRAQRGGDRPPAPPAQASKDKRFVRKLNGAASTRMPRWKAEELAILRESYPTEPNIALAHRLGRSVKSVVSKAHQLGLGKTSERLREMGRQNVSVRYI